MATNEEWVKRLDFQWRSLRRTEDVLSVLLADGGDVSLTQENIERYAREYGSSIRQAPPVALLLHARNLRSVSPQ